MSILLIAFDVSGSVVAMPYEELLPQCKKIETWIEHAQPNEIYYVWFDHECSPAEKTTPAEIPAVFEKMYKRVELGGPGGGGSDSRQVYAIASQLKATQLLLVTDGYMERHKVEGLKEHEIKIS